MNLQTQIPLSAKEQQIDYASKLVLLGSCFTENIGEKLDYFKFQNVQNPFGVIFNPVSLENLVVRAVNEDFFTEENIFQTQSLWHCFEVHSSLSASHKESFLEGLNNQLKNFREELFSASHIIITLGSAWVYQYIETKAIVANCHKIPQREFQKKLLSVETISKSLESLVSIIQKVNPIATFIFTISPVRHVKDGFVENTRSKAYLIGGIHQLLSADSKLHYFPSFELMMDELRDYRFYAKDMLHPNELAIEYIWEKFKTVWIAPTTENLQKEIDTIQKGLRHKVFHPESEEYLKFDAKLRKKMEAVKKALPFVKF